jgi:hypothetical protein
MASSSTGTLPEEELWEWLPEELLLKVLDGRWTRRDLGAVRGVCRRWRAIHDAGCKRLDVGDGMTDETMHVLCGRLPSLTTLHVVGAQSLTTEGHRAVGGLTALTLLDLYGCSGVTDAGLRWLRDLPALTALNLTHCRSVTNVGLRELRDLTALTWLSLAFCSNVTDVGLEELTSLTSLTQLNLPHCSTTEAGRDALKAAIPGITIFGGR